MKRISVILPDLQRTRKLAQEMEKADFCDGCVHVLGKEFTEIEKARLSVATVLHTTDLVPAVKRGLLLGAVLALGILCLFYFILPEDISLSVFAVIGIFVFGLIFGGWASTMIGIGIPNKIVEASQAKIEAGHYLLMIDVPAAREQELRSKIHKEYPEAYLPKVVE